MIASYPQGVGSMTKMFRLTVEILNYVFSLDIELIDLKKIKKINQFKYNLE